MRHVGNVSRQSDFCIGDENIIGRCVVHHRIRQVVAGAADLRDVGHRRHF